MNNKLSFFLVFSIMILAGCNNDSSSWYKEFNPESKIIDIKVIDSLQGINMASPFDMHVEKDLLILEDIKLEKFIHFIDTKEMSLIKSEGRKGKGPGEIISSYGGFDIFNNNIWFYDGKLSKYIGYHIDSLLDESNYIPTKSEIRIDPKLELFKLNKLSESEIIGYGFNEDNFKYTIIDIKNSSVSQIGELPPNPDNIPNRIHKQVYDGIFEVRPSGKKIAFASLISDLIEIYDVETNKTIYLKTANNFAPIYDMIDREGFLIMGLRGETRLGYRYLSVTKNKIYCLFSGQTMDESQNEQNLSIHVFNWEGEFEKTIQLDRSAISITVDENDQLLYSVIDSEIPTIYKYKLTDD